MKYVYQGPYTEFRGYVFAGKPVDITDKGTLELIAKRTDFKRYEERHEEKATTEAPVLKRPILSVRRK